jgi:hypothetical protein
MVKNMTTTTKIEKGKEHEVEIHEINLESLYCYAPQRVSEEVLEYILQGYSGLEYKILVTFNPDNGAIYFDKKFEEFVLNFSEDDIQLAAIEYAKQNGYDLVVLNDGYEFTLALIREKDK